MFAYFKSKSSLLTALREARIRTLNAEQRNGRDDYLLEVYRKQIAQTGKAAARHKRRAARYRKQVQYQQVDVDCSRAVSNLLHERSPDWVFKGLERGQRPAEAMVAAITDAFNFSRATVLLDKGVAERDGAFYRVGQRIVEATDEESRALIEHAVTYQGRIAQIWHGDAATGQWDDLPVGEVPNFTCPMHFYRLKPEPIEVEAKPAETLRPTYPEAVAAEQAQDRTPLDAVASMAGLMGDLATSRVDDDAPAPPPPNWGAWEGNGGTSGGAGASASWDTSGGFSSSPSPSADFSDVSSSVSSTESFNSSND